MVKVVRKVGKKVNFGVIEKKSGFSKKGLEIKKKFSEIKVVEGVLNKIQKGSVKGIRQIKQKEAKLEKMFGLWDELSKLNVDELSREEMVKVVKSQKNFIKDLLKHYKISIKKEKQYVSKLKKA